MTSEGNERDIFIQRNLPCSSLSFFEYIMMSLQFLQRVWHNENFYESYKRTLEGMTIYMRIFKYSRIVVEMRSHSYYTASWTLSSCALKKYSRISRFFYLLNDLINCYVWHFRRGEKIFSKPSHIRWNESGAIWDLQCACVCSHI